MSEEDVFFAWVVGAIGALAGMCILMVVLVISGDIATKRDEYMKSQGYVWNYEHKIYTPIPRLEGVKPSFTNKDKCHDN